MMKCSPGPEQFLFSPMMINLTGLSIRKSCASASMHPKYLAGIVDRIIFTLTSCCSVN